MLTTMDDFLHNLDWVLPLRSNLLTPVFSFFSWLGYTLFFFFALPLLYWTWDKRSATRLAAILAVGALITFFLKDLFRDPRPPVRYLLEGEGLESYGFPSGHTLIALVFWLTLAAEVSRRWVTVACVLTAIGIAFSRLYLGVHDLEDILGGAALGAALFGLSRLTFSPKIDLWEKIPALGRVGLAVVFPIALLLFWPDEAAPDTAWMLAGFLPAWVVGRTLEMRWLDARKTGLWKTTAGVTVGLLVGGFAKFLLGLLAEHGGLSVGASEIAEGIVLGIALTLAVPALVCALKLMRPNRVQSAT